MNKMIVIAASDLIFSEMAAALDLPEGLTMIDLKGTKFIVKKSSGVAIYSMR